MTKTIIMLRKPEDLQSRILLNIDGKDYGFFKHRHADNFYIVDLRGGKYKESDLSDKNHIKVTLRGYMTIDSLFVEVDHKQYKVFKSKKTKGGYMTDMRDNPKQLSFKF